MNLSQVLCHMDDDCLVELYCPFKSPFSICDDKICHLPRSGEARLSPARIMVLLHLWIGPILYVIPVKASQELKWHTHTQINIYRLTRVTLLGIHGYSVQHDNIEALGSLHTRDWRPVAIDSKISHWLERPRLSKATSY